MAKLFFKKSECLAFAKISLFVAPTRESARSNKITNIYVQKSTEGPGAISFKKSAKKTLVSFHFFAEVLENAERHKKGPFGRGHVTLTGDDENLNNCSGVGESD